MPPKVRKSTKTASQIEAEKVAKATFFLVFWFPYFDREIGEVSVEKKNEIREEDRVIGKVTTKGYVDKNKYHHNLRVKIVKAGDNAETLYKTELDAYDGHILTDDEKRLDSTVKAILQQTAKEVRKQNAAKKAAAIKDSSLILQAKKVNNLSSTDLISPVLSVSGPSQVGQRPSSDVGSGLQAQGTSQQSLSGLISLYHDGVAHHVSAASVEFVEAFFRVVESNVSGNPETAVLRDVLRGLFDVMAEEVDKIYAKLQLPKEYFKPGGDRVDLFKDGKIFVPHTLATLIDLIAAKQSGWRHYVATVLGHLYGNALASLTTCGSAGSMGVDRRLLNSLHTYCSTKYDLDSESKLSRHVTNLIHNKKKTLKRRGDSPVKGTSKVPKTAKTVAPAHVEASNPTGEVVPTLAEGNGLDEREQHTDQTSGAVPNCTTSVYNYTPINQQQQQNTEPVIQSTPSRSGRSLVDRLMSEESPGPIFTPLLSRMLSPTTPESPTASLNYGIENIMRNQSGYSNPNGYLGQNFMSPSPDAYLQQQQQHHQKPMHHQQSPGFIYHSQSDMIGSLQMLASRMQPATH